MRRTMLLAVALLGAAALSCSHGRSPTAPAPESQLDVYVTWNNQGVPDRLLEIVDLGLAQRTDAQGNASFELPAGSHTLRAHVNGGGPAIPQDIPVTTTAGDTTHLVVEDCLPCVSPN